MKMKHWMTAFLTIGMLAFAGCGGGEVTRDADSMEIQGVQVALPKLEKLFASATDAQRATLAGVQQGLRYGQYTTALMELEKLKADTALTPDQKKVADEVFEQVKQVAAKAPAPTQ